MKTMLFDLYSAQPVGSFKFHGGGEYIKRIFKYMIENFLNSVKISVFYNIDIFIDEWIKNQLSDNNIKVFPIHDLIDIQNILNNNCFDIFYTGLPYHYNMINFSSEITSVATFHGLRPIEKYTDRYEYKYFDGVKKIKPIAKKFLKKYKFKKNYDRYYQCLTKFNKIICVSNYTRYSIINFYPSLSVENIKTFYTPAKVSYKVSPTQFDSNKFILILGVNRWEKNSYRALMALDNLFKNNQLCDYSVVCVGTPSKSIKKSIKHVNKFQFIDYVDTETLEQLYCDCDFFIFPSLNEGFGMPPLEAMRYGKTCIVSAVSSIPEICGNAVYYINPYDIYEIQNKIIQAVNKKIDKEEILKHYKKIFNREEEDLQNACRYILNI